MLEVCQLEDVYMERPLNLFSFNEKYPKDDENRLTSSFMFSLSESRHKLLPEFLRKIGITEFDVAKIIVRFQVTEEGYRSIPDAEICSRDGKFRILIEAKRNSRLDKKQLEKYATRLATYDEQIKKLLFITRVKEREFDSFKKYLESNILKEGACDAILWSDVVDLIKASGDLDKARINKINSKVVKGKRVMDYEERLSSLFLDYIGESMYSKKTVNELNSEELFDVTVTTQDPWFMYVALKHNVWFPSGSASNIAYSKYAAYYETNKEDDEIGLGKNTNPKMIKYIAKNITYWTQITVNEAKKEDELKSLFEDEKVSKVLNGWSGDPRTFAKTDNPIKLKLPIIKGKKSNMNIWKLRHCSLVKFRNAETTDDLQN